METPEIFVQQVRAALEGVANPALAEPMARYMKNHFVFLGIPQPVRDTTLKFLSNSSSSKETWLLEVAILLWSEPEREFHYVALGLLSRHAKTLSLEALPTLERLVVEHAWWDTVDALANQIYGVLVKQNPQARAQMDLYSTHSNFWLRRIAILHQLGYRENTDQDRLLRYCLESAGDPEFFLRKAIGWALREYAKTSPEAVLEFVETHRHVLSSLSVREALKHLI